MDGPTPSARVGTNSSLSKASDKRSVMNDLIVSFSIEIQGFSLAGPAGTEQRKASAATIWTTPSPVLLTKSRKTKGKPSQHLLMRVLSILKLEHA